MILYPAIDLKDGRCVRLLRGEMDQATVFNDSPSDQAHKFAAEGVEWLHLVDLNGAFAGKPVNQSAVLEILSAVRLHTQLGGGIRDMATVEMWLEAGINRIILGTIAVKNPNFVLQACRAFPGQIAVGIDAKEGKVATDGWANTSTLDALELALRVEDAGACAIIYTDISRDGAMQGPNFAATAALAERLTTPVILSGGISSMEDIRTVKQYESSGIEGVIAGRAVYEGKIDLRAATALLSALPST